MRRLLIVDDDFSIRTILQEAVSSKENKIKAVESGEAALNKLKNEEFDLVISDLMMDGMSGIELMENVKKTNPEIGFLIITAYGTIKTAVDALQKGAFDFITKPFSISHIKSRVDRFFEFQGLKQENKNLKRKLSQDNTFNKLVGQSQAMRTIYHQIDVVANSDAPVFIQGESGTGKELIAQAVHENSSRFDQPFLKVNCPAIPETLFESTLFGHEKGSFTNAIKTYKGLFEEAHGGTLLLDEISEMPTSMQAKLLRVLQEEKITRVGSTKEISIDVRIIATSNQNINKMIENENFRSDLFFRLNVFPINVPNLRSRPDDIQVLIEHFLKKFQTKYNYTKKIVKKETLDLLCNKKWPGNVRQLENLIERAILYSGKETYITLEHFSFQADPLQPQNDSTNIPLGTIAEMEKQLIFQTLKKTNNNRTKAAKLLDISVRTLRNKLHQYNDDSDNIPEDSED